MASILSWVDAAVLEIAEQRGGEIVGGPCRGLDRRRGAQIAERGARRGADARDGAATGERGQVGSSKERREVARARWGHEDDRIDRAPLEFVLEIRRRPSAVGEQR